jgi:hypothetical protein
MFQMMGVFAEFERAMIAERVRPALRGPGVRANALGVPQSLPHWRNESVKLWRFPAGPVSASLPNSLELIPAQCSESVSLSSRRRSRCEARQTLVEAGCSIQDVSSLGQAPAGASRAS